MTVEKLCTNAGVLSVISIVLGVLKFIFIAAPILAIVMISIDFLKNVIQGDEEAVRKNMKITIKRMIFCVAVFFVPTITSLLISLLGDMGVNYTMCIENSKHFKDFIVEEENDGSSSQGGTSTNPGSSSNSSSSSKNKKNDVKFKLSKDTVVISHYRYKKKMNTYTISIQDSKGKKLSNTKYQFTSNKPGVASVTEKGVITGNFGGTATITVTSKADSSNQKKLKVTVIHSIYIRVTLTESIRGTSTVTGKTVTLKKGTSGVLNGVGYIPPGGDHRDYYGFQPGDTIKTDDDYVQIESIVSQEVHNYSYRPTNLPNLHTDKYYKQATYSKEIAEEFVNSLGYDSNTNYLFWSSHGAQVEYMFTGKKGNWKLYKTFPINTGDCAHLYTVGWACTGVHFNYTVGPFGPASTSSYPIICKSHANGAGCTNPWHPGADTSHYPKSHGCTRFRKTDISYLASIHSKIKGSRIIEF